MVPDAALALCRFLHDAGAMMLFGAFGYLAVLVPGDLGSMLAGRLNGLRMCTVVIAVVTTAARLPIEVAAIGEGWGDALDPATVRAVLFETSVGGAWQGQAGAALLLAATLFVPARWSAKATASASGLLLASLALTGHAAMHEGRLGWAHRANDAVHVLAGGAWVGALVPLLLILRLGDDPARRRDAAIALRRFSSAGHGAVALVIATGSVNTLLILGRWPTDWSSPYQALLALKIAMVGVMTLLALANRYVLVPRLGRDRVHVLGLLRLGTLAEIGLAAFVIGCVGVFGLLEPASPTARGSLPEAFGQGREVLSQHRLGWLLKGPNFKQP